MVHASCVAVGGRAVLITGPSGAGKSALALQLIALGADLVSDDQTALQAVGAQLIARPPAMIAGLIEARGLGLLHLPHLDQAEVALVADLAFTETERLPPQRQITLLGLPLSLVYKVPHDHFPSAIMCYLKATRCA